MRFTKIKILKLNAFIDMRIVSTSLDYITKKGTIRFQYLLNVNKRPILCYTIMNFNAQNLNVILRYILTFAQTTEGLAQICFTFNVNDTFMTFGALISRLQSTHQSEDYTR